MTTRKHKVIQVEGDGLLEWLIYRRLSKLLLKPILKTNITPNHVTFVSLIFACLAGIFLIKGDYILGLFAALCIFIVDILDNLDGDLARKKKISTGFGSFFDAYVNVIAQFIFYLTGTIGLFSATGNPLVIFAGMFALSIILILIFLSVLGKYFTPDYKKNVLNINKKLFLSAFMTFDILFMTGLLFNVLYYVFWFVGTAGMIMVLRHIVGRYNHYKRLKT